MKPTSATTIARVADFPFDSIKKIEMLFYHDTDEISNLGFNFGCENTLPPYATTGFYLSTNKILLNLYWKGSTSGACAVNVSALENKNWYKMTAVIAANISYKLNKMTITDNLIITGSDINSTSTPVGTQTPYSVLGIFGILLSNNTSNYSSQHRIAYLKFYGDNDELLFDFQFCNNGGTKIFNLVNGDSYPISNINESIFYDYKQDFIHKNFENGFTKYIKTGSRDILVTNSNEGDQITTTESGYSVVRNVGGSTGKTWNGCESRVRFDDVEVTNTLNLSGWGDSVLNGSYHIVDIYEGKNRYIDNTLLDYTHFIVWQSGQWKIGVSGGAVKWVSNDDVLTPDLVTTWVVYGTGTEPSGIISISQQDDLFIADKNHIWFESDGTANEIKLGTDFTCDGNLTSNEGFMFINDVLNYNTINFYIFNEDKILIKNTKILQKIDMGDVIVYDGDNATYEGNYTVMDYEITF